MIQNAPEIPENTLPLIEAVKQLKAENDAQQEQIKTLQEQNQILEKRLAAIEESLNTMK